VGKRKGGEVAKKRMKRKEAWGRGSRGRREEKGDGRERQLI